MLFTGNRESLMLSQARQFFYIAAERFGVDEIPEGVGGIVTAEAFFVHIDFENVFGTIGIVLENGQALDEAAAALMNKEGGLDSLFRIAEAIEDFGPAVNAIGIGLL